MVMGGVLFAIKKLMSVLQLIGSAQTIAERDLEALVTEGEKKKEWLNDEKNERWKMKEEEMICMQNYRFIDHLFEFVFGKNILRILVQHCFVTFFQLNQWIRQISSK